MIAFSSFTFFSSPRRKSCSIINDHQRTQIKRTRAVTSCFSDETSSVNKTERKESMLSANKEKDPLSIQISTDLYPLHILLPLTQNCTQTSKRAEVPPFGSIIFILPTLAYALPTSNFRYFKYMKQKTVLQYLNFYQPKAILLFKSL